MDSRTKAKLYSEQVRKNNAKSGSTKSQFGNVGRNIDAESEKPKLTKHGFVDEAKPVEEQRATDAESTRQELDKIEQDEAKEVDRTDFKREEPKPVVRPATVKTDDKLITDHKVGGVFAKAWTIVDHIVVPEVIQPRKSNFLPNFISATIIVEAIEHCLDGVEELKWISPYYFSLPARIYWSVLFYVQILKAKEAASRLSKTESTWFRAFKRIYPLESLPVIGPLVPFYTNIVAVKPNDDMYDFIFPDYFKNFGLSVEKGVPTVGNSFFLQPNILLMSDFLRQFTQLTLSAIEGRDEKGELRYFDDDDSFIPHRIGNEKFSFAGIEYSNALTAATAQTLTNPGLDRPLPEGMERIKRIYHYWSRSKSADIPTPSPTDPYDNIGASMRMIDDFEWFEDCIEMATTQCKFFSDSMNMSQIPSTGGSEVLVSAHLTGAHRNYKAPNSWYPKNWKNLKAQFHTTRADTTYEQFFNAAYALTTATISWQSNGHPIGGRQSGQRTGPYWDNRLFQFVQDSDQEVARRVQTMVRSLFFDAHGKGSL